MRTALRDLERLQRAADLVGWRAAPLVVARTFWERLVGIAAYRGRDVVIAFPACRSVHTWFMRAPLDIVFVDAEGGVLRWERAVPPGRVRRCVGAVAVLERYSGVSSRDTGPGIARMSALLRAVVTSS